MCVCGESDKVFPVTSRQLNALHEWQRRGSFSVWRFAVKRVCRLFPVLVALIVGLNFRPGMTGYRIPGWWWNLAMINTFMPVETTNYAFTWTVSVEVHFYILFPLLAWLLFRLARTPRWRTIALSCAVAASLVGRVPALLSIPGPPVPIQWPYEEWGKTGFMEPYWDAVYDNLWTRCGPILVGALVAQLVAERGALAWVHATHKRVAVVVVAGVALFAFAALPNPFLVGETSMAFGVPYFIAFRTAMGAAILCVVVVVAEPESRWRTARWLRAALSLRLFFPLAMLSYSIYLVHFVVIVALPMVVVVAYEDTPSPAELYGLSVVVLAITAVLVLPIYLILERPFVMMARVATRRKPMPVVVAETVATDELAGTAGTAGSKAGRDVERGDKGAADRDGGQARDSSSSLVSWSEDEDVEPVRLDSSDLQAVWSSSSSSSSSSLVASGSS